MCDAARKKTLENWKPVCAEQSPNQVPARWQSNKNKKDTRRLAVAVEHRYTPFILFSPPENKKKKNRFINIQKIIVKQLW